MKILLFLIAALLSISIKAQIIFKLSESKQKVLSNRILIEQGTFVITEDNSWISTGEAIDQPDEIIIYYKLKTANSSAIVITETSSDGNNWVKAPSIRLPASLSETESIKGAALKLNIKSFVRFTFLNPDKDSIRISDITIKKLSVEGIQYLNNKKNEESIDDKIRTALQTDNINSLTSAADNLIKEYEIILKKTELLASSNSQLLLLTDLSKFFINRTSMANPIRYQSFNNLIKQLQDDANDLDSILIDQLKNAISVDLERKNPKATGFLNTAYNIGNLITGGKLSNVFNGIKQIFARTYAQGNMLINEIQKSGQGVFEPINTRVARRGADDGNRSIIIKATVIDNVRKRSNESIQVLKEMDSFMEVLDRETNEIDVMMVGFKESGINLNNFEENLFNYIKDDIFSDDFEYNFSKADFDLLKVSNIKTIDYINNIIGKRITKIKNQLTDRNSKSKISDSKKDIEKLTKKLNGFAKFEERYLENAYQLFFICTDIKEALTKENPFTKDPVLAKYSQEWQKMKDQASENINKVPEHIKEQYITRVRNKLTLF